MYIKSNDNDMPFSKRKLRYTLLCDLKNKITNEKELLFEVAEIYESFDCPNDMNDFIYYIPVTDDTYNPSAHSKSENYKRLTDLFCKFLEKEKDYLENIKNKSKK